MPFSVLDSAGNLKSIGATGATGAQGAGGAAGNIGPVLFLNDGNDGNDAFPISSGSGSAAVTESLAIAQAAQPATLNLTTEGTIDWLSPNGSSVTPRQQAPGTSHTKASGGFLNLGFDWIIQGGTLFTQNDTMQVSDTLSDSSATAVLTNSVLSQGIFLAAGTGIGWRIQAPPSPTRINTLRLYCSCFSAVVTVTAILPSGLTTNLTFDSGAAAALLRLITVTYQCNSILNVYAQMTTNRASTPNVKFQCATLA